MSDISPLQHFLVLSNAALHPGRRAEFIPCSLGLLFITGTKKKSWIYKNSDAFILPFISLDLWVTSLIWAACLWRDSWLVCRWPGVHTPSCWMGLEVKALHKNPEEVYSAALSQQLIHATFPGPIWSKRCYKT